MGPVAIASKLKSCEHRLADLQQQREYAAASTQAQVKKVQDTLAKMKGGLQNLRNSTKGERAKVAQVKAEVQKEVDALQKEMVALRAEYDKQFAEWYHLKNDVLKLTSALQRCKCSAKLLQVVGPSSEYMYDTAYKVQQCEAHANKLEGEIQEMQLQARRATTSAVQQGEAVKRAMSEEQRMHRLLSRKGQIEQVKKTKAALEAAVEGKRASIQKYREASEKLRGAVEQMTSELRGCGCQA